MATFVGGRRLNSVKVRPGLTHRRYIRMEQLARLEATGLFRIDDLAAHFNVSVSTLHIMRAQPEYARMRASFVTGVVDTTQDKARLLLENQQQELEDMVPQSLRALRDALIKGTAQSATVAERKLAVDVAKEVLDREGSFAKISKSEIKVTDVPTLDEQKQVHNELLGLFQSADAANSGDKSAVKVLDSFVSAAGDKSNHDQMMANINLDDLNVKDARPQ